MKDEKYVKKYFKNKGTVATWWNPTKSEYSYLYKKQIGIIKDWLKKVNTNSCLEVSCGKGRVTQKIHKTFNQYLATDISKEMISIAKKKLKTVDFKEEDAELLNQPKNKFDCVICLEALVHYPNPSKALKEFNRVLKKNGVLIIDYDNKYSIRRIIKSVHYKIVKEKNPRGYEIFKPYSKKEFLKMMKKASFKIKKFKYLGVISPIELVEKKRKTKIISSKLARKLNKFPFDSIPFLNGFATFHLVLAEKNIE
jgi:ubiquinone/menaquinone biosynthesis C-methylase UbiE